jgi:hypothetical protein
MRLALEITRLALAALLGLWLTVGGVLGMMRVYGDDWGAFAFKSVATVSFAVITVFLVWRFAHRFAKPSY